MPLTLSLDQYTKQANSVPSGLHGGVSTDGSTDGSTSGDRAEDIARSVDERELHSPSSASTTSTNNYASAFTNSSVYSNITYELSAVVVHVGSLDSGHYYTISKVYDNITNNTSGANTSSYTSSEGSADVNGVPYKWLKFNDDKVSELSEEDVLIEARGGVHVYNHKVSSNAYMLFYTRT